MCFSLVLYSLIKMNLSAVFLVLLAISQALTFPTSDSGVGDPLRIAEIGKMLFSSVRSSDIESVEDKLKAYTDLLNQLNQLGLRLQPQPDQSNKQEDSVNEQPYQPNFVFSDHPTAKFHNEIDRVIHDKTDSVVHDQGDDVAHDQTNPYCNSTHLCDCDVLAHHVYLGKVSGHQTLYLDVPYCSGICDSEHR